MSPRYVLIITDLDGTLLDHNTYSFDAARPALQRIRTEAIPLILNSSKTAAEMRVIREQLNINDPFIVENGNGIYIPEVKAGFEVVRMGRDRISILKALDELQPDFDGAYIRLSDMSIHALCEYTGLTADQADDAMRRDFTEPLIWQDTEQRLEAFNHALAKYGLHTTRGGRFVHVMGKAGKGEAVKFLRDRYRGQSGRDPFIIGLGDSENDREMLEAADRAVIVRNPAHEPPVVNGDHVSISEATGPAGWNRSVLDILDTLIQTATV